MKRREAKGLTAGLAMLGLVCAPAGAAAQTFEQPTLAPPVMAPPPAVMPGAPSAPPIALDRSDRRFLDELSEEIDRMIAEVNEARARTLEEFAGDGARAAIARAFERTGIAAIGPGRKIFGDPIYYELSPWDTTRPPARPPILSRSTDYGESAWQRNETLVRNIVEVFHDRYIGKLKTAKEGLAARPSEIARQAGVTPPSMTRTVRSGLEADLKYLQGGHELWKSTEADLRESLLPTYRDRLLGAYAGHARYTQLYSELVDRRERGRYELELRFVAARDERMRQVEILESYPPGSGLGNENVARIRALDDEMRAIAGEIETVLSAEQADREIYSSCALSLGIWANDLEARPRKSPPVSIYEAPQHAVSHLGGRPYFRPYETDAMAPDLRKHLEMEDPCGAAPPPEEVPARLSIVIPRFEAPPPPDLLDDDDLAAPMPSLVFEPANEVYYGHPFHVEALFEEDRPGSTYSVRLNGQHSVIVEQTEENPRLYRSATLVLTYRGLIHGGGR